MADTTQQEINAMAASLANSLRDVNKLATELITTKQTIGEIVSAIDAAAEGMKQMRVAVSNFLGEATVHAERIIKDARTAGETHELRCAELRRNLENAAQAASQARVDAVNELASIQETHEQARRKIEELTAREAVVAKVEAELKSAEQNLAVRHENLATSEAELAEKIREAREHGAALKARLDSLATVE